MPIYEYQCKNCDYQFDLMQKYTDKPATQCPKCFENSVVKLVSAAGFQLKGTGWYATDFKNNNKPAKETGNTKKDTSDSASGTTATKDNASQKTESKQTDKGKSE